MQMAGAPPMRFMDDYHREIEQALMRPMTVPWIEPAPAPKPQPVPLGELIENLEQFGPERALQFVK